MRQFVPVFLMSLLCGCSSEPRAPALFDSPVYHSDEDGFRFLMPDGWVLTQRAQLPSGRIEGDRVIVQYLRRGTPRPGTFEVSRRDDWKPENLDTLLREPSHGVQKWEPNPPPESFDIAGTTATRYTLEGALKKEKMTKELVVFQRKDRVYLFRVLYQKTDESARNQFRRIIEGLTWLD